MSEFNWNEYAKKKRKEFGIKEPVIKLKVITNRHRMPVPPVNLPREEILFNVHKRTLPVGTDKIVVIGAPLEAAAQWRNKLTKSKKEYNESEDNPTKIYYDVVPVDATQKRRSVYFNNGKIVK